MKSLSNDSRYKRPVGCGPTMIPEVVAVLARADQMAIPVIVLGEYRYGIAQSRNRSSYEAWLTELLNDCTVLDINEPTARDYAEIVLELKVARANQSRRMTFGLRRSAGSILCQLLSRDRHFDGIEGIKRIGW